jgi:hypothetical protein
MDKLIIARRVHSELAALRKLVSARRAFVSRLRRQVVANMLPSRGRPAAASAFLVPVPSPHIG